MIRSGTAGGRRPARPPQRSATRGDTTRPASTGQARGANSVLFLALAMVTVLGVVLVKMTATTTLGQPTQQPRYGVDGTFQQADTRRSTLLPSFNDAGPGAAAPNVALTNNARGGEAAGTAANLRRAQRGEGVEQQPQPQPQQPPPTLGNGGPTDPVAADTNSNTNMDTTAAAAAAPAPAAAVGGATPRQRPDGSWDCRNVDAEVHFLTYANKRSPSSKFCRSLHSAVQNKVDVKILNWGGEHKGLGNKFVFSYDEVKTYNPCEYVVFYDAYDVLFAQGPAEMKRALQSFPDLELMFSAECGCWPQVAYPNGMEICDKLYPQSPTPYRYVNTGVWAARAWAAARFLKNLISKTTGTAAANDQEMAANMWWRSGGKTNFTLDYHSVLFQNMHPWRKCVPKNDLVIDGQGEVYNKLTDARSVMVHFSGGGKDLLLSLEHGIWYMQPAARQASARHPARVSYEEVSEHRFRVGPVPGVRESDGWVSFRDTKCGDASKYVPERKWKAKW